MAITDASPIPSPKTEKREPETVSAPETENGKRKTGTRLFLPEPPEGVDFCAAKGAGLFLMAHGYPQDNPPKHIPNRRHEEDTQGFSLFREIRKILLTSG